MRRLCIILSALTVLLVSQMVTFAFARDRGAVRIECFYALNPSCSGGSSKSINGWTVSDWNYLWSDSYAWDRVNDWYPGDASSYWEFWYRPWDYGLMGGYGRAGQCRFFANLILFRSGALRSKLKSYREVINDYNGPRRFTKLAGEARVGDILQTKWKNGHTAIVVQILEGVEGVWATKIDVVDCNYVGGQGEEIIGRHILQVRGRGLANLDDYIAIDLDRL